jgi:hypothetical protein
VDDASFLGDGPSRADSSGIVVSVSGWFGHRPPAGVEASLARLIDSAANIIGEPVRFHAHFGPLDPGAEPRGDAALHERIRARLTVPSTVVPTGDPRHAAALARGATLLLTSRYHPAVFAAPAGVPTVGLVADTYTGVKLGGALEHWGEPPRRRPRAWPVTATTSQRGGTRSQRCSVDPDQRVTSPRSVTLCLAVARRATFCPDRLDALTGAVPHWTMTANTATCCHRVSTQ